MSQIRSVLFGGAWLAASLAACNGNGEGGGLGDGASEPPDMTSSGDLTFSVAPHGDLPQVIGLGGKVLFHPKVVAISWNSDPNQADVEAFLTELTTTPYWGLTTSEYGVGALTVSTPVHLTTAPPGALADSDLVTMLSTNLGGANPAWGAADPSTIYLFIIPDGTSLSAGGACCQDFDGYHDEAMVGAVNVPYAISCSCPGFDGPNVSDVQQVTVAASHELVEAATDPFINSNPAFAQNDDNDAVWTIELGGEVADMCELSLSAYVVPDGSKYMVQKSWSNAAAAAGNDPCLPSPRDTPGFNSLAVLPDIVTLNDFGQSWATTGVTIPAGQSKTIDVQLWSSAPTSGPWTVTASDYNKDFNGGQQLLDLSLDRNTGSNGDVLKLTITVLQTDRRLGGEVFVLESDLGNQSTMTMGVVGN